MLYLTYGTIVYLVLLMKAYAISAILKIFAFEISLGRKIDMLPEVNGNKTFFTVRFHQSISIHSSFSLFGATKVHYMGAFKSLALFITLARTCIIKAGYLWRQENQLRMG